MIRGLVLEASHPTVVRRRQAATASIPVLVKRWWWRVIIPRAHAPTHHAKPAPGPRPSGPGSGGRERANVTASRGGKGIVRQAERAYAGELAALLSSSPLEHAIDLSAAAG